MLWINYKKIFTFSGACGLRFQAGKTTVLIMITTTLITIISNGIESYYQLIIKITISEKRRIAKL